MSALFHFGTHDTQLDPSPPTAERVRNDIEACWLEPGLAGRAGIVDPPATAGDEGGVDPVSKLRLKISSLLETAVKVEFAVHEDSPELQLLAESEPWVKRFVEQVLSALEDLKRHYTNAEGGEETDVESSEEIGAQIFAEVPRREIVDLGAIAAMVLREATDSLNLQADSGSHASIVSSCDAAMHKVRRALIPLENALCSLEGLPAPYRQLHDVSVSVRTREHYAKLRHAIVFEDCQPSPDQISPSLANVAHRFRLLRSTSVYPYLRINDRLQMRALDQRVRDWLRIGSGRSLSEGQKLWQDTVSFLSLLAGVNARQELQVHDLEVASAALRALADAPPGEVAPEGVHAALQSLFGRNDEIDKMLLDQEQPTTGEWVSMLTNLLRDLREGLACTSPQ